LIRIKDAWLRISLNCGLAGSRRHARFAKWSDKPGKDKKMAARSFLPSLWDRDKKSLSDFGNLRQEMDKVFDEFSRGFGIPEFYSAASGFDVMPQLDIHDTEREVKLGVELPGVEEKNIDISITGETIIISGEKKSQSETKESGNYRSERSFGSFRRSVTMPFKIDADRVTAKFANGVLTVSVPKPAEVVEQTKKIAITS
jgi:HSP20 family protein